MELEKEVSFFSRESTPETLSNFEEIQIFTPITSSETASTSFEVKDITTINPQNNIPLPETFDLKSVLYQTTTGRAIASIYEAEGNLDTRCQGYLVDIITEYLLNNNYR